MESRVSSLSTSQPWSGATLGELARIWDETSPQSEHLRKITSSLACWRSRRQSQIGACGLVLPESPTTSSTGSTTLHWRVIILRGRVENRTIQMTMNIVGTCLAEKLVAESGMTYSVPWKSPNLSTPQVLSARNSPTELTMLLFILP